jgi:hypothetical protein
MIRMGRELTPEVSPIHEGGASGERGRRRILAGGGAGGGSGYVSHFKT